MAIRLITQDLFWIKSKDRDSNKLCVFGGETHEHSVFWSQFLSSFWEQKDVVETVADTIPNSM